MESSSNWLDIVTTLISSIAAIAGGGWGGVAALAVAIVGGALVLMGIIKKINGGIDGRDMDNSGTFPAKESADIKKQAKNNDDLLDALEKQPPKK